MDQSNPEQAIKDLSWKPNVELTKLTENIEPSSEKVTNGSTDLEAPLAPKEEIEAGALPEIKTLFKGPEACECCVTWTEVRQKPKKRDSTESDHGQYSILARKTESHGVGLKDKLHSLVIQSEDLRDILTTVLENYPGVTPALEGFMVQAPFRCFFHRWDQLEAAQKTATGNGAKNLELLISILKPEFAQTRKEMNDMLLNKVITHSLLWTIFQPGEQIHSVVGGQDLVGILQDADYTKCAFALKCKMVDYDGVDLGYDSTVLNIPNYAGTMALSDLRTIPFKQHPAKERTERSLIERGKRFLELRDEKIMHCKGKVVKTGFWGQPQEIMVSLTRPVFFCFSVLD